MSYNSTGLTGQTEESMGSDTMKRVVAEFFGTFWLVFGGCGAAVLAAAFPARWASAFSGSRSPSA